MLLLQINGIKISPLRSGCRNLCFFLKRHIRL